MSGIPLRHRVEYAALVAFSRALRALPRPVALEVGAAIGGLGWSLRIRRHLVLANLAQALPDATPRERRRIGFAAARNFGRTMAEFVRFPGSDRQRLDQLVTLNGENSLR